MYEKRGCRENRLQSYVRRYFESFFRSKRKSQDFVWLSRIPDELDFSKLSENSCFLEEGLSFVTVGCESSVDDGYIMKKFEVIEKSAIGCVKYSGTGIVYKYLRDYHTVSHVVRAFWDSGDQSIGQYKLICKSSGGVESVRVCAGKFRYISNLRIKDDGCGSLVDSKIITYDFETYTRRDGVIVPYAVGIRYGGEESRRYPDKVFKMFYLTDYPGGNENEQALSMVLDSLKFLLRREFRGWKVYAHNLSGFDGPLLLKYLSKLEGFTKSFRYRNGVLYTLSCSYPNSRMDDSWTQIQSGGKVYNQQIRIVFKDSYLLLPRSLRALAQAFGCEAQKGEFPHEFASYENLNYKGVSPVDGRLE